MRKGLGRAVEPRDAGLVHQADPDMAVLVDLEVERALRVIGLLHRDRIVGDLAGLRIELRQELLAEMRVPDHAVGIDDHVVRLDLLARKIVFGDDDAGRAAGRPRRGLELEADAPRVGAEIDAGEIVGEFLRHVGRIHRRAPVRADQPLRLHVGGARIVAAHALEHLQEIGCAVLANSKIRCSEWQSVQLSRRALELVGPGALAIHSALVAARRDWRRLELEVGDRGLAGRGRRFRAPSSA